MLAQLVPGEGYHQRMKHEIRPRIRVVRDDDTIVFGPGKADLLHAIAGTGSIRAAAANLDMSYMRAWTLVKTMNAAFAEPLVEKVRGGADQGGARLTSAGKRVLRLYRTMERAAMRAVRGEARALLAEISGNR